ncbi:MAG: hypothetical protein MJ172_07470 [Clostridia bacterium]|nr:hypothetical protein [Clostridia bacterium]
MLNRISLKSIELRNKVESFLTSERGDTNFISILIILVIVCALAATFIGFKNQIISKATSAFNKLLGKLN